VRDSLTSEMWETVNDMWLESCQWVKSDRAITQVREYLDWIKLRSHLILGVALGTMLKDETFNFLRMGTFIERADNTARLLDLKFFESSEIRQKTQDATNAHDDTKDFYHWAALLRSVSGFEVYRQTYHDVITPARVAELLIFRKEMPRSLAACLIDLNKNIAHVRNAYSQKTERLAGKMLADLQYGQIEEVLQYGIHEYLTEFLEKPTPWDTRSAKTSWYPESGAQQKLVPVNTPATNERMRFEITHNTDYHYEDPISYLIQLLRLTPRSDAGQTVINWHIGAPTRLHAQIDAFGNHTHLLTLNQATKQLLIEVRGTVEVNEDASSNRRPAKNSRISPLIFTQATRYTTADAELNAFAQPFAQPTACCPKTTPCA